MRTIAVVLMFFFAAPLDPIIAWNHFEKSVRDGTIGKEPAKREFPALYRELKTICSQYPFQTAVSWRFPVQGCGVKDIGAGGFRPNIRYGASPIRGYDFYDGNRHGGHPAYDIFIRDSNLDSLDDRNKKSVAVIAPVDILILSTENTWNPDSELRGGRYIWALDPMHDQIWYFAHLNEVRVKGGDFCKAGTTIGTVGRTGKSALPARSPTHLHLMVLTIKGDSLTPFDYMEYLKNADFRSQNSELKKE